MIDSRLIDENSVLAAELRQQVHNLWASLGQLQVADVSESVLLRESLATLRLINERLTKVIALVTDQLSEETLRAVRKDIKRLEQKL